jgi:hypothetical protein
VTSTRSAASSGIRGVVQRHPDKPFIEIQRFFKVAAQWVQYGPNGHMPESVANASQDAILHQINQEFPVSLRGNVVAPSKADLEQQCAVAMKARGIVPQVALSIAGGETAAVNSNTTEKRERTSSAVAMGPPPLKLKREHVGKDESPAKLPVAAAVPDLRSSARYAEKTICNGHLEIIFCQQLWRR